jgi:hypothetical protein
MSFKATITLDNKEFDVLACVSEMGQGINQAGKATSSVRGGDLRLTLRGEGDDDTLPAWALDKNKEYAGTITFFKFDGIAKFREIKFEGGYITWFAESFMPVYDDENYDDAIVYQDKLDEDMFNMAKKAHKESGSDYLMLCKISAQKISIDSVEHDNHW